MEANQIQGKCIVFSAPSGAGKTTIVKHLLSLNLGLEFSISACSRPAREGEVNQKDYYFFSIAEFKAKIEENEFIEWEEVYKDMFYGTLKSELDRIWKTGKTVIFDVDVVGGLNIKKQFPENTLAIFVNPPSVAALEERLRYRSTETEEKIQTRLAKATIELNRANEFDYILNNFELKTALKEAENIVANFIAK